VTQIINNPTLIPDGGHGGASAFFQNKGAVTGVFVVVGLAATAIAFFVIFFFRRKRRVRQRDHDTTIAETLEEYGIGRQDLIEPDDHHPINGPRTVTTPTGSGNSADVGRTSSPSMSLSGINPVPVSAGGFTRYPHHPTYPADNFGPTYNPYADNRVLYHHADPGPSNPGGIPNFSALPGSGVPLPFFGNSQQDGAGSSEQLLGANSHIGTSLEPTIPSVPPRNPLRLMGDPGNISGDGSGHVNVGGSNDESTGYRHGYNVEYEGLRKGSLKVRNNPD